ncbi:MAG: hypothetical protein K2J76_02260 [Oscillospiraceae bacterium]|nr:hypothetical protein [Oscillospiraceae bacterium]
MEKIKKSFTRNFLPIFIAAAVFWIFSAVFSVMGSFGSLLESILMSPIYVGLYSFLFKRMEDENPDISLAFSFYKSGSTWWKSFWVYNLGGTILGVLLVILLIMCVSSGFLLDLVFILITVFLVLIGLIFFILMPYLYAKAPYIGIGDALEKSFKFGFKYMYVFFAIYLIIGAVRIGFFILDMRVSSAEDFIEYVQQVGRTMQYSQSGSFLSIFVDLITTAFSMWANFTAAYIIIEREKIFDGNYNYISENDMEDEEPFIEPYDFFIEEDRRFNDEKVIETEDIRGVDILAVLDEMELIYDIKVNFVIRRKLKKMFGELSFEIGEYDVYNSGRSIENSFTEEIDDREFEVSVEITRNSDYEPFKLTLRVNVLEEE